MGVVGSLSAEGERSEPQAENPTASSEHATPVAFHRDRIFFLNMTMSNSYDLIVVGAGPAGLACAIEAQRAGMEYLVIDKGGIVNAIQQFQRSMFFFSTPELLGIGGIPFIVPTMRPTSLDCVNYYREVAEHYALRCRFYEEVTGVGRENGVFVLKSKKSTELRTRALVLATGYYFTPNPLGVQGEYLPHVSHYYHDPYAYFQQDVLVVGGKNSAVEAVLDLYRHGARVTLVHRGSKLSDGVKYWILPDFENRMNDGAIKVHFETRVSEFKDGSTELEDLGGQRWVQKTDFAFILIGYRPDVGFLTSLGINVDSDSLSPAHNPETMETNVPGLFVAGGMVGGRFNNRVFIENGREHGKKIVVELLKRR